MLMGWDRKAQGAEGGYFYKSVRVPHKPYPVKIYFGRGARGQEAAAEVEERKRQRQRERDALRAERETIADADLLAAELREWADMLMASWLVLMGHYRHHGTWRLRRGRKT
jgi:hypothetical protein